MSHLPPPDAAAFTAAAAAHVRRRLEAHGRAPWSVCEARLGDADYACLRRWAEVVTGPRLDGEFGLVLLAFVAEWNRRNSPGGTVWVGLPSLFGVESARRRLFTTTAQPTAFLRRAVRETCEGSGLRHAFGADQDEDLRYYLSIQLQYGFSLPHAREQLPNWLGGHRPPEVALRLLDPDGPYRSASFRRLVRDMKSYRSEWLAESEFRHTLRENPWVLPAWEDELVELIDSIPRGADEDEPEFRLLSDPRVEWDDGPEVWCRVCGLPDRLTAPRYLLRHAGRDIARYYRGPAGAIEPDRTAARLTLVGPEAVVTLETPDGVVEEVQTVRLWDPAAVAQVRPLNRAAEEAGDRLLPGELVLMTAADAAVTPEPSTWRAVGPRDGRRRWWLIDGGAGVRVESVDGVWTGEPPLPPPAWTLGVSVNPEAGGGVRLGERVRFKITAPAGVEVNYAVCAGLPLNFADAARTRTLPVPVRAEMSGRCRVRVGVTRGAASAVVARDVSLPVRALCWASDGRPVPPDEPLACTEATTRPVRLLTDGPALLVEGREVLGVLATGRAARVRRLLGTGQPVRVADRPFNTHVWFAAVDSAVDTGLARSLEADGDHLRLTLFRPLEPGDRHRLVLWAPGHGVATVGRSEVTTADGGRVWSFRPPWDAETALAAVAYDGRCLGTAWRGEAHRFFDPQAADGLDPLGRIGMVRWCRLPALRPDAAGAPLVAPLARFPIEMVRVALRDEGLPAGLELEFDDRQSPRGELFNVVFREAFVRPAGGNEAALFDGLPHDFERLLAYHPLLGFRALRAVLPRLRAENASETKKLLTMMRMQLLSVGWTANPAEYVRREEVMLARARVTCCENGELMDEYAVQEGLVGPVLNHLFHGAALAAGHEDNLRTALGVAPFRAYLAARLLRRLLDQPT